MLHNFDFQKVKILDHELKTKSRLFKEMIYIKKELKSINHRDDIKGLNIVYNGII